MEEADVEIQTDAFLDRPPSPLFIPAKSGVDEETQIYEGDVSTVVEITNNNNYNIDQRTDIEQTGLTSVLKNERLDLVFSCLTLRWRCDLF